LRDKTRDSKERTLAEQGRRTGRINLKSRKRVGKVSGKYFKGKREGVRVMNRREGRNEERGKNRWKEVSDDHFSAFFVAIRVISTYPHPSCCNCVCMLRSPLVRD
jgi:hypothetical protein